METTKKIMTIIEQESILKRIGEMEFVFDPECPNERYLVDAKECSLGFEISARVNTEGDFEDFFVAEFETCATDDNEEREITEAQALLFDEAVMKRTKAVLCEVA